jgi:hypothetical protein
VKTVTLAHGQKSSVAFSVSAADFATTRRR